LDSTDAMTTNRTPIQRPALTMISPRALALFAELERARRARLRAVDCTISEQGLCTTDCRACRAWSDAHNQLHVELRLQPWQWPCFPRNPYPPGSPKAREWRPSAEQKELWDLLTEARRAAVVATTSLEEERPYAEPVAGQEPSI
jgi:hypothetical protein